MADGLSGQQPRRVDKRVEKFVRRSGIFIPSSLPSFWSRLEQQAGPEYRLELEEKLESRAGGVLDGSIYELLFRDPSTALATSALVAPMLTEWLSHFVRLELPEGDVLDLACGNGLATMFYATLRPNSHVIGIDSSPAAVSVARAIAERLRLANVQFRVGDVASLDLSGQFAIIVSTTALRDVDPSFGLSRASSFSTIADIAGALASGRSVLADTAGTYLDMRGSYLSLERLTDAVDLSQWVGALAHAGMGVDLNRSEPLGFDSLLGGVERAPAILAGPNFPRLAAEDLIAWWPEQSSASHDDLRNELEFKRWPPLSLIEGWHFDVSDAFGKGMTRVVHCHDSTGRGLLYMTTSRGHRNLLLIAGAEDEDLVAEAAALFERLQGSEDVVVARKLRDDELATI